MSSRIYFKSFYNIGKDIVNGKRKILKHFINIIQSFNKLIHSNVNIEEIYKFISLINFEELDAYCGGYFPKDEYIFHYYFNKFGKYDLLKCGFFDNIYLDEIYRNVKKYSYYSMNNFISNPNQNFIDIFNICKIDNNFKYFDTDDNTYKYWYYRCYKNKSFYRLFGYGTFEFNDLYNMIFILFSTNEEIYKKSFKLLFLNKSRKYFINLLLKTYIGVILSKLRCKIFNIDIDIDEKIINIIKSYKIIYNISFQGLFFYNFKLLLYNILFEYNDNKEYKLIILLTLLLLFSDILQTIFYISFLPLTIMSLEYFDKNYLICKFENDNNINFNNYYCYNKNYEYYYDEEDYYEKRDYYNSLIFPHNMQFRIK